MVEIGKGVNVSKDTRKWGDLKKERGRKREEKRERRKEG